MNRVTYIHATLLCAVKLKELWAELTDQWGQCWSLSECIAMIFGVKMHWFCCCCWYNASSDIRAARYPFTTQPPTHKCTHTHTNAYMHIQANTHTHKHRHNIEHKRDGYLIALKLSVREIKQQHWPTYNTVCTPPPQNWPPHMPAIFAHNGITADNKHMVKLFPIDVTL